MHTKCTYERTQSTSETTAWQRLRGQPNLTPRRQRAVQTTSAYLHWCGADPPSSLSTPAPGLSMAPRNEVIFLQFWRGFLLNCSVVQSLLHVGHRLFIAVANDLHHHPFLRVLWFGHISSRSLNRSWLVINDWHRFCEDDAPRLRSS